MAPQEKKEWQRTIFSAIVASLTVFVLYAFTQTGDGKKDVINRIQKVEIEKANIKDVADKDNNIIEYIDKQDKNIKDELNSKLDIVINNQRETNGLLRDLNNK